MKIILKVGQYVSKSRLFSENLYSCVKNYARKSNFVTSTQQPRLIHQGHNDINVFKT